MTAVRGEGPDPSKAPGSRRAHRRAATREAKTTWRGADRRRRTLSVVVGPSVPGFELVAHARIGAHHIFKTKFMGPTTLVVQARWADRVGRLAGASARPRSPGSKARRRADARVSARRALIVFESVLVANRGEIALRVIRACRGLGIRPVAVYSEADAASPPCPGSRPRLGSARRPRARATFDRARDRPERDARVDAIHPGYGFLSENWRFAEACQTAGLAFVGPPPEVLRTMGQKTEARRLVARAGSRCCPGPTAPSRAPGRRGRLPTRSVTRSC